MSDKMAYDYNTKKPRIALRNARWEKNMTQEDLRKELLRYGIKLSTSFISKVENGKREPSIETVIVWVTKILGKSVEECFPGTEFKENTKINHRKGGKK